MCTQIMQRHGRIGLGNVEIIDCDRDDPALTILEIGFPFYSALQGRCNKELVLIPLFPTQQARIMTSLSDAAEGAAHLRGKHFHLNLQIIIIC